MKLREFRLRYIPHMIKGAFKGLLCIILFIAGTIFVAELLN